MKFNRFTKILAMTAALAIAVTATVSCSGGEASYKVNVKNALGDAYTSGIVVQFMQNGEKVAMDYSDFRDYFPPKTTDRQIHKVLIKLVRIWHRQQQLKKTQEAR